MPAKVPKLETLEDYERTPTPSSPTPSAAPKSTKKRSSPTEAPSTPTTKKARKTPSTTPNTPLDLSIPGWTPEKKVGLVDRLLTAGIASLGAANLAKEFNVDTKSMSNALAANRPGNVRDKAVKGAKA